MSNRPEKISFFSALQSRIIFGPGKITRMTPQSHPEIMRLYEALCQEHHWPQRDIYVVDSPKHQAIASFVEQRLYLSKALLDFGIAETLGTIAHERQHLNRGQFLTSMAILTGCTLAPQTLLTTKEKCEDAGYLPRPSDEARAKEKRWLFPISVLAGNVGFELQSRYRERDSDKAAAEQAGAAWVSALKKLQAREMEMEKGQTPLQRVCKKLLTPLHSHGSTEHRIRRAEQEVAKSAKNHSR